MPHFCVAVNVRAVWKHSCVTLTHPSHPLWLFIHAQQAPRQAAARICGLRQLVYEPSNNSTCQASVHHLSARSYRHDQQCQAACLCVLQVLLVEAGLQSATAGLEGSEVCTRTCTCCLAAVPGSVGSVLLAAP